MPAEKFEDIDALIENEKRALIAEYFRDAWSELTQEGIDPSMVAEIFIEASLKQLVADKGNEPASKLLAHFRELDEMGFLPSNRTLQ